LNHLKVISTASSWASWAVGAIGSKFYKSTNMKPPGETTGQGTAASTTANAATTAAATATATTGATSPSSAAPAKTATASPKIQENTSFKKGAFFALSFDFKLGA
jgi:hypothetical protein